MTNPAIKAKAFLDTGSLPSNFITVDLLKRIKGSDCLYKTSMKLVYLKPNYLVILSYKLVSLARRVQVTQLTPFPVLNWGLG
jgi:hypothetical protein